MADQDTVDLIACGPFAGLDTRSAGPYAQPGSAAVASNSNTHRLTGALCTSRGRVQLAQFLNIGPTNTIAVVAEYIVSPSRLFVIVQDAAGRTLYYDSQGGIYGTLSKMTTRFTQAVQSNGVLWCNNGQQIFLGPAGLEVAQWQYPAPDGVTFDYTVVLGPDEGPLQAGYYSYAFVQVVSLTNVNGVTQQRTSPTGVNTIGTNPDGSSIYPYQLDNPGTTSNSIYGTFAGLTSDGYPYVTEIYRFSSNSPNWFLLTTMTTNGTFVDTIPDEQIAGNAQLVMNRDVPPTGGAYGLNPIAAHQNRMWVLVVVQNADTNNVPQTQLQYSNVGQPWSFDIVLQVLLCEDEDTTMVQGVPGASGVPFGDQPSSVSSNGSALMICRRTTMEFCYGVDQATYQIIKLLSDLGNIAPLSAAALNGKWYFATARAPFSFDGNSLQWPSEKILNLLASFAPSDLCNAVGFASGESYFLSYPLAGITLRFYEPGQAWETLPYWTPSATGNSSMPSDLTANPLALGQILAVRPNSQMVDFWNAAESDLALPITATWQCPETNSGKTDAQKDYRYILIDAPLQPGVACRASLYVNGALVKAWTFDLGTGPLPHVAAVPGGSCIGALAYLKIELTNPANATGPAIIYAAKVGGHIKRAWSIGPQVTT
jgi:hypothetical protein